MKQIKLLLRLMHINYVLAKNGLDNVVVSIHLFAPLRFIVWLNPWNWFRKRKLTNGEALRKTLEDLGPIFIKFGQALSTRPDLLPPDIAMELAKLQDKVPPFDSRIALDIIHKAYGKPASEVFAKFDEKVLASASMAQVYAATLKSGQEVVVKVLRPKMRAIIEKDLKILHIIANLANRYWAGSKRLKPKEIVTEFEHNLLGELDLQREAANASQLKRNFQNSELLYIPEVYWDYTRTNVFVLERISGIPVSNIAELKQHGIDLKLLAERGVEIFFTQVFRDSFFHADMHPGNIFVSYDHPQSPQCICIDFGIIGTLDDEDKRYLVENLLAFFNRDYKRVAQLHVESGWVPRTTRVADFEAAIRTVCEPIFEKPLKDISFGKVVLRLFETARYFHMEVQPQLVLLQKTLLAIEGLGRQLDPELDLWSTAKPFLEKWVKQQIGPKALVKSFKENLPFWTEQLPHMPKLIHEVLSLNKEQLISHKEQKLSVYELNQMRNKSFTTGVAGTLGLTMLAVSGSLYFDIVSIETLTWASLALAGVGGLMVLMNWLVRN